MELRSNGVLITGGSGFLGRALAKRILDNNPGQRVCIYSRGEHQQAAMFKALGEHPNLRMFIGDVRDASRLRWAMESVDVVIHAAALKRIEVGHYNPAEMVKTNVLGAMNVVEAAISAGVSRVVLSSTDKAYQPVSPYGISKAMAEAVFLAANNTRGPAGPEFCVCRYGNVAGSTGSVIERWWDAKRAGVTRVQVTDPDCTRFWMTIDEAVDLVLAAANGAGTLLIPTLPAFTVGNLATAMGLEMELVGLPAWEKKHETLAPGITSDTARRMTVAELEQALMTVGRNPPMVVP